ncbi:hypothetical protein HPB50_008051 [Hyalomma asiaticum]|uniref:Uncharacterized protein n=1 Tax=Hyalomma asiaticum TaxID=266040 RepID=A0ACB7TGX7_HYAAI|nr:hypothetical protein HPB50_008051 [Hyalomma asiaticum]
MPSENRTLRNLRRVGNADARPRTMRREAIKVASISARHRRARRPQRCGRLCLSSREGDTPTGRLGTAINPVEHITPRPPQDPGRFIIAGHDDALLLNERVTCACGKMSVAPHDSAFSEILKQISHTGWEPLLERAQRQRTMGSLRNRDSVSIERRR